MKFLFTKKLTLAALLILATATSAHSQEKETPPAPTNAKSPPAKAEPQQQPDFESSLKAHVEHLATTIGERNLGKYDELCEAADYIETEFKNYGLKPTRQTFKCRRLDCYNIAAEIKGSKNPDQIIIVGAHYDSAVGTPAANDNGSGTAAMLVLAKHFSKSKPDRTLRFVAFPNEEPPYFQTEDEMGSWVYAKMCRMEDQNIVGVISLETMGYFTDEEDSQHYPPPLDRLYPSTGNFIGFVGNIGSGKLMRNVMKNFKANSDVPAEGASLPGGVPGVGWSDHWSFWQEGYEGIMITDTAPYRYPHYHKATDTPDKMNFPVFAKVVEGLVEPIKQLVKSDPPKDPPSEDAKGEDRKGEACNLLNLSKADLLAEDNVMAKIFRRACPGRGFKWQLLNCLRKQPISVVACPGGINDSTVYPRNLLNLGRANEWPLCHSHQRYRRNN